jgi:acetyltransferase-like isoleucine patch superfamily enzyme
VANDLLQRLRRYISERGSLDTLRFLMTAFVQLLRGCMRGYWLVFVGKSVTIRARKMVAIGRFTRIEDFVELDGFGEFGIVIGSHCKVGKYSILRVPPVPYLKGSGIRVACRTTFAEYCFVGGAGRVEIGLRNAFGQYTSIHPENHLPKTIDSPVETRSIGIRVGDDNWFGAKATLLDGCSIGSRSIFAAGSIVRGSFPDGVMAAGVPAKIKSTVNE